MRESGDLLNDRKTVFSSSERESSVLVHAEKRLRQSWTAAAFALGGNIMKHRRFLIAGVALFCLLAAVMRLPQFLCLGGKI